MPDVEQVDKSRPRNPDGTYAKTDAEPTPTQQTPAPTPPEVKDPHRKALERQAAELGFAEDEISDYSTAALGRTVNGILRERLTARDRFEQALASRPAQQTLPPAAPVAEPVDDLPINEAELHPDLLPILKGLKGSRAEVAKQIKELKEELAQAKQRETQRDIRSNSDQVDEAFEALGEKWQKLLGAGPGRDLGEDQIAEFKRRIAILNEANIDCSKPLPPKAKLRAAIKSAAEVIYPQAEETPAEPGNVYAAAQQGKTPEANGKSRITTEQWNNAALAAPTQREQVEPPGEEKAVKNLAKKMREKGITPIVSDGTKVFRP